MDPADQVLIEMCRGDDPLRPPGVRHRLLARRVVRGFGV